MKPREVVLIVHNVRSCHNVGSLLRTADGLGISTVHLTGYTPYPAIKNDSRLPHLATRIDKQIHKTALGAENTVNWQVEPDIIGLIKKLRGKGFKVAALEQTPQAVDLASFKPPSKIAIIVGNELSGLESLVTRASDYQLVIPMLGAKESFNVAVAGAIGLYHMRCPTSG